MTSFKTSSSLQCWSNLASALPRVVKRRILQYCILYTLYCILYTVYCILYTVYYILYTVRAVVLCCKVPVSQLSDPVCVSS